MSSEEDWVWHPPSANPAPDLRGNRVSAFERPVLIVSASERGFSASLNRCAIILRPKRPYASWVETIGRVLSKEYGCAFSNADGGRTVYLIPPGEDLDSIDEVIERIYPDLFERELSEWYEDEALWPKPRTLKMFREWFDVELCTMIVDLVETPLIDDEVPAPVSSWSRISRKLRGE